MPAAAERLNMFGLSQSKACSPTMHLCRYLVGSCENLPKQSYCLLADAKEYMFTFVDVHKCKQLCFCGKLFMCILPQLSGVHLSFCIFYIFSLFPERTCWLWSTPRR